MNLHDFMMQNPRPDRPQFDGQAFHALDGMDARQDYRQDFRSQLGDFRDAMQAWRLGRRNYMQGQPMQPAQGLPTGEVPQPIGGYGMNLGQVLQRFPQGIGQPGPTPGY